MVFGEITTTAKVDYEAIVRKTCKDIGFVSEDVGLDADTLQGMSLFASKPHSMQACTANAYDMENMADCGLCHILTCLPSKILWEKAHHHLLSPQESLVTQCRPSSSCMFLQQLKWAMRGLLAYVQFSKQRALCDLYVKQPFLSAGACAHRGAVARHIGQGVHGLGTKTLEEVGAGDQAVTCLDMPLTRLSSSCPSPTFWPPS